ncbi:hypothetical protein D6D25_05918 [Aureobasidium pullulans]|nr:hypothetical protein D6D25_05918 [Aureobasidium pullulans]
MTSTDLFDYMVLWMASARCTLFATSSANIDDGYLRIDFSYLRIDFSIELNTGYAFVNFTHPEHITNFVNANIGKPWSLYGSTKRCEVSYATIQGIDCLLAERLASFNLCTLRRDSGVPPVRLLLSLGDLLQTTSTRCAVSRVSSQSANLLHKLITALCCPKLRYHHESVDLPDTYAIRPRHSLPTFQVPQVSLHCATVGRRSGTCLLTTTLCHPKLWYHHESDDLPDTSTVGTEAPCPVCADVRRTAFRARNSMSYATDFVWYSLLPSAPVIRAQGRKRSRDNATTIGLFPSRHGKRLVVVVGDWGGACPTRPILYGIRYCPQRQSSALKGASVLETTQPPSVPSPLATARVPTARVPITARELTTNRSVVVPSDWGGASARGAAPFERRQTLRRQYHLGRGGGGYYQQGRILGPYDNDDGNPPPTVRWWFPAIEEERQHEEQRLVRFERRQVGYRGNGQYQQFGRARHQQCAVLLGYEEVKNMTNAENFEKYDEAAFRAAVSADPEFRYCMSTTCKSGQCHPAGIDEPTFCCRECGHNHCVSCEANWHEGLTCAQYQHSLQRAQEEEESQQEVAKSSAFVGSKLKTSQGTSSLRRALLGQHDRGTSFAIEEECQHESSGGIASPGNDTSTGFLPFSSSSNINQFTSFGGFGGGGTVAQINNGHFPADNYTTAGMDMSAWSTSAVR